MLRKTLVAVAVTALAGAVSASYAQDVEKSTTMTPSGNVVEKSTMTSPSGNVVVKKKVVNHAGATRVIHKKTVVHHPLTGTKVVHRSTVIKTPTSKTTIQKPTTVESENGA